jgi:hypothetical protein
MPCGTAVLTAVPVARAPGGSRHEPGARATGCAGKGSLSCTEPWASSAFLHCPALPPIGGGGGGGGGPGLLAAAALGRARGGLGCTAGAAAAAMAAAATRRRHRTRRRRPPSGSAPGSIWPGPWRPWLRRRRSGGGDGGGSGGAGAAAAAAAGAHDSEQNTAN